MHRQLPSNELMGIQPTEWYDWCNDPGNTDASWCRTLGLDYPPCAWVLATNDWLGIDSCAEFISENKGKTWYVGNEPNCGAGCGGWYFTPQDYASHFHSVYQAVKELDSTARVITAAWINNCYQWDATDGLMIDTYYDQWGTMPADAYNIHYYQSYTPTNPDGIAYVQCFLDNLAQKKLEGKVSSDKVRITEFGWLGFDEEHGTEENVLAFMNYLIPYLKTQPRIERAYWWQWAYYTFFFRDGAITPAGKTYQERAR